MPGGSEETVEAAEFGTSVSGSDRPIATLESEPEPAIGSLDPDIVARAELAREVAAAKLLLGAYERELRRGDLLMPPFTGLRPDWAVGPSPEKLASSTVRQVSTTDSRTRPSAATPTPADAGALGDLEAPETPQAAQAELPTQRIQLDLARERWVADDQTLRELSDIRIAGILDDELRECLRPDCHLLADFGADDFPRVLEDVPPDVLLVESAWGGNGKAWQYMVASYDHPHFVGLPQLRHLLSWCRARGIPTVFWNTQDPLHFTRFEEAAMLFDRVFSSDANCLARYADVHPHGSEVVNPLMFAAQPKLHNPVAVVDERDLRPALVETGWGSERPAALEMLLEAARPYGLATYDLTDWVTSGLAQTSERSRTSSADRRAYGQRARLYKSHHVVLNVEPFRDSPTMVHRSVFELLACETAVLSTESLGIGRMLGDVVTVVRSAGEAAAELSRLLTDEPSRRAQVVAGRRLIFSHHTYRERLGIILESVGQRIRPVRRQVAAAVLVDDDGIQGPGDELRTLLEQDLCPSEILVGATREVPGEAQLAMLESERGCSVRVVAQDPRASRSERYAQLARLATAPWVVVFGPGIASQRERVSDLLAVTEYTDADVIGSLADGSDRTNRYVDAGIHPGSALVSRTVLAARGWPELGERSTALNDWFREGVRLFATNSDAVSLISGGSGMSRERSC